MREESYKCMDSGGFPRMKSDSSTVSAQELPMAGRGMTEQIHNLVALFVYISRTDITAPMYPYVHL
jgi:hypothetical protein